MVSMHIESENDVYPFDSGILNVKNEDSENRSRSFRILYNLYDLLCEVDKFFRSKNQKKMYFESDEFEFSLSIERKKNSCVLRVL